MISSWRSRIRSCSRSRISARSSRLTRDHACCALRARANACGHVVGARLRDVRQRCAVQRAAHLDGLPRRGQQPPGQALGVLRLEGVRRRGVVLGIARPLDQRTAGGARVPVAHASRLGRRDVRYYRSSSPGAGIPGYPGIPAPLGCCNTANGRREAPRTAHVDRAFAWRLWMTAQQPKPIEGSDPKPWMTALRTTLGSRPIRLRKDLIDAGMELIAASARMITRRASGSGRAVERHVDAAAWKAADKAGKHEIRTRAVLAQGKTELVALPRERGASVRRPDVGPGPDRRPRDADRQQGRPQRGRSQAALRQAARRRLVRASRHSGHGRRRGWRSRSRWSPRRSPPSLWSTIC